jgi:hypothetical protein
MTNGDRVLAVVASDHAQHHLLQRFGRSDLALSALAGNLRAWTRGHRLRRKHSAAREKSFAFTKRCRPTELRVRQGDRVRR